METVDAAVNRILAEKIRLGLFERPYADEGAIDLQSRQAIVILENRRILPLDPGRGQRIALVGPTADDPLAPLCLQLPRAPHPQRRGGRRPARW